MLSGRRRGGGNRKLGHGKLLCQLHPRGITVNPSLGVVEWLESQLYGGGIRPQMKITLGRIDESWIGDDGTRIFAFGLPRR